MFDQRMDAPPKLYIETNLGIYINDEIEWNEIELKPQIERRKSSIVVSEIEDEMNFNQLTLDELDDYFELIDIQDQLMLIKPEIKVKSKKKLINLISRFLPCKIPKLKKSLLLERDRLLAVALIGFGENEHMNIRLLITIYEILKQRKGHFADKINRIQNSTKPLNYLVTNNTISSNLDVASSTRTKSFRRFKNIKSYKSENHSLSEQSKHNVYFDEKTHSQKRNSYKSTQTNYLTTDYNEIAGKRTHSFDLSALKSNDDFLNKISQSEAISSQYKYKLNDETNQEITNEQDSFNQRSNTENCNNSLDSFQTSLNSNFEYLSASGFSDLKQYTDFNSNHLNDKFTHQFSSADHLSKNNESNFNRSFKRHSRASLRSANHCWYGSRKNSTASSHSKRESFSTLNNEKISVTLFHRMIRYGDHWLEIGFQGNDPVTDLRDLGLLSLFQLCFFLINYEHRALKIFKLSQDNVQNFPFVLIGINISQICLQTLRQGHFNRVMNARNEVFRTINLIYSALFFKFYQIWTDEKKTIFDSNDVLKELRVIAASKSKQLLDKLGDDPDNECSKKLDDKTKKDEILEFTDLSKIPID